MPQWTLPPEFENYSPSDEENGIPLIPIADDQHTDEDEEEEVVMSSPSLPLVKSLIKRIVRASKLLKESKETIEKWPNDRIDSSQKQLSDSKARLFDLLELFHFLWARLLRLLNDEHEHCADLYTQSLNMEDRVPFESLTHAIHRNTKFCDILGEIIDFSYERRPLDGENISEEASAILQRYYSSMVTTQLIATNCGLLVVEGSRESFLDPIAMFDLCKTVASEPARRKRLIPLSLMFSMLDQDDQATAEALAQHIPKILLQRLRHLVHKIFGYPEDKEPGKNDLRSSPHRYRSAAIRSSSRVGSVRASSGTSPVSRSPIAALVEPNQELSSSPLCSPLPVPPGVDTFQSPPQDSRKRVHGRGSSPSKQKWRGIENPFNSHDYDDWSPYVGEKVGRGPGWKNDHQGKNCDFGEVIGLTSNDEVVIKWVPSIDTVHADSAEEHLFRYSFKSPHCEVVSWERFLLSKTMQTDSEGLALQEFLLICAVVGVLCQQRETIVPVLQFQTLESITHVLDSTNLAASFAANEEANDDADLREKRRLAVFEEDGAVDEEKLADFLSWDMDLRAQKRSFREDRELIARVGWVLNALLGHRKLALLFLDGDGVGRILGIIEGPMDVSTIYGCGIVLSHIAKVAVFEEVLRRYENYFLPIMKFVVHHWQLSSSADVQGSVGAFLYHVLSFPRALNFFDESDGPTKTIELLERLLKISEEQFDISSAALQLISLKCMNIYLISHLMLSTKVVFRKHRVLSTLVTKSSPNMSLPRDPATVDAVLGLLSAPSPALPDISADNVQSLLAPERVLAVQALIDKGFHSLLLRCTNYYFVQSRWELLTASLQALCVLTVVPYIRPMIAEPRSNDSGIAQLIIVVNDLSVTYRKGNAFRETHLLPCVIAALQILINITTPPLDVSDEAAVSKFNTSCAAFRASDGVRTLLEVLNIKKDAPMSAKRNYFPVIARAVQLMVTLRRFGDTFSLFEALGVHRVAQELLHQYSSVQKEYISLQREYVSMMGPRKLHAELDPAGRFMDNIQTLIRREARFDLTSDVVKAPLDPMEIEQRQAIVGRAEVDYSRESLLRLIADHLESEGLFESAEKLLEESNLQVGSEGVKSRSDPSLDLDSIVRSYLRLRQENCPNPIETLPLFDLTKKHVYIPPPAPADETRNLFNRLLTRKMCPSPHLRFRTNESCMIYRNPAFMFDITGTGEGLQGECIAFCDDGDTIIIGTSEGAIALFDTFPEEPSEDKLIEQHLVFENESISSLVVSDSGDLIAAVNDARKVKIMPRNSLPVIRCELPECRTVRFSHDSSLLLGTCEEHSCRLFDLGTQQELRQFIDPVWHGDNSDNIALFDGTSQLILNDAVLWDIRCSDSPIVRFDRITESFASTFHPYLPLVIIDEKVWDMRTMKMVQTVPTFQKASSFHVNRVGRAIYSFREASSSTNTANPIVSAVDSYSFEPIFSEEVHPPFKAFALDPSDRYCAAILDQDIESVIRFFSTSSGPFPDVGAFASPVAPDEPESEVDEGDDSEDWSSGDDGSISSSSDDSNEDDHDDQSNFEDEESINTENDDFAELAEHEGSSEEIEESTDVSADSETQSNNST